MTKICTECSETKGQGFYYKKQWKLDCGSGYCKICWDIKVTKIPSDDNNKKKRKHDDGESGHLKKNKKKRGGEMANTDGDEKRKARKKKQKEKDHNALLCLPMKAKDDVNKYLNELEVKLRANIKDNYETKKKKKNAREKFDDGQRHCPPPITIIDEYQLLQNEIISLTGRYNIHINQCEKGKELEKDITFAKEDHKQEEEQKDQEETEEHDAVVCVMKAKDDMNKCLNALEVQLKATIMNDNRNEKKMKKKMESITEMYIMNMNECFRAFTDTCQPIIRSIEQNIPLPAYIVKTSNQFLRRPVTNNDDDDEEEEEEEEDKSSINNDNDDVDVNDNNMDGNNNNNTNAKKKVSDYMVEFEEAVHHLLQDLYECKVGDRDNKGLNFDRDTPEELYNLLKICPRTKIDHLYHFFDAFLRRPIETEGTLLADPLEQTIAFIPTILQLWEKGNGEENDDNYDPDTFYLHDGLGTPGSRYERRGLICYSFTDYCDEEYHQECMYNTIERLCWTPKDIINKSRYDEHCTGVLKFLKQNELLKNEDVEEFALIHTLLRECKKDDFPAKQRLEFLVNLDPDAITRNVHVFLDVPPLYEAAHLCLRKIGDSKQNFQKFNELDDAERHRRLKDYSQIFLTMFTVGFRTCPAKGFMMLFQKYDNPWQDDNKSHTKNTPIETIMGITNELDDIVKKGIDSVLNDPTRRSYDPYPNALMTMATSKQYTLDGVYSVIRREPDVLSKIRHHHQHQQQQQQRRLKSKTLMKRNESK